MMKRLLALIIAAILVFSCVSAMAIDTYSVGTKKVKAPNRIHKSFAKGVESNGITYVAWLNPPDEVKASSVNNRVSLSWSYVANVDFLIYEIKGDEWTAINAVSHSSYNFTASNGEHTYAVSSFTYDESSDEFYESEYVTCVKITVLNGSDNPPAGADIQECRLSGTGDQKKTIHVYDNTYLHITTDSLTWLAGYYGAIIMPDFKDNSVYFTSLGNNLYINPRKYISGVGGYLSVATYYYNTVIYGGVQCYAVNGKKADLNIVFIRESGLAPGTEPEQVKLKKISIKKAKATSAKKIKVEWKKLSSKDRKKINQIEIQYSTDKNFKNNVKTKKVSSSKSSYTISGLKKNTKYYIRIRAFTKSLGVKLVSKWSSKKSVKTKK